MQIISRKDAIACGLKTYFTGIPCVHGHVDHRRVANHSCVVCHRQIANKNKDAKQQWNFKNREYFRDKMRERRAADPDGHRNHAREYMREKYKNPDQKVKLFLGASIRKLINSKNKKSSESIMGYSRHDLVKHLERQFLKGMSWDNYGKWHIDHITPVSWFVKNGIADPMIVNSLPNLRPIWASENMRKGDKIEVLL